jgi:hypothetical protein
MAAEAPIEEQQQVLLDRICAIRATTTEGLTARAKSLALWAPDLIHETTPDFCYDTRMAAALLRDMVGSAAA